MKKFLNIILIVILLFISEASTFLVDVKALEIKTRYTSSLKATKLGIGGGGALFEPSISPFNSNEMLVIADMGGIYISHDKGLNWNRVNLYGTVISATYDPNIEGVIYAGGSGLYRSTDNGKTFKLLFPYEDDIIKKLTHNENGLQYYFTKSNVYNRNRYVKDILIDPNNSNHIFILCYSYKNGTIFESTDNGESFKELFSYSKSKSPSIQFDLNKLFLKSETNDLFLINDEEVIKYNLDSKTKDSIYKSNTEIMDATSVFDNNKTNFIVIEKSDKIPNSKTRVYYTNDFINNKDITNELISTKPNKFTNKTYGEVEYRYEFHYVSATSLNNIYVTNWTYADTTNYPYSIDGIIHYHNGRATFLYGNPFRDHNNLASRAWCDGNTYSLGIAASKTNESEFIFTTLCGVYYSEDGVNIYPRYSTTIKTTSGNKFVTNGIDEQATYGVVEDPFHKDVLFLLNTDLGLIRSDDNGKSWVLANNGIPNKWVNTVYDLAFDKNRENYVYSIWSGRHNAPYNPKNETDNRYGGFAISTDGGKTWNTKYSSGLPENVTPVKMDIVYKENSNDVEIYLATFNEGFFVSHDSGRTFRKMNEGLDRVSYKDEDNYRYILAADIEVEEGRIFGLTAKNFYNGNDLPGEVFEYVNGKWKKLNVPKNLKNPRDIYFHNGTLYISSTATAIYDYKNGSDFNNYGGGVYAYKNGNFTQIFDDAASTTGTQIDSKGTIYISDINGNIYRKEKDKDFEKIYDSYHYISKGINLVNDDKLYLASFGGGLLRLEGLNSLYDKNTSIEINTNRDKLDNKNLENNKVTSTNISEKVKVPNTLQRKKTHLVISIILIALGLCIIVYANRDKITNKLI